MGSKIEGTAYNYKGQWGLDTIKCFDEWGFQYWHDVRPGNTFSSKKPHKGAEKFFPQGEFHIRDQWRRTEPKNRRTIVESQ
jgi:hypothetical protein